MQGSRMTSRRAESFDRGYRITSSARKAELCCRHCARTTSPHSSISFDRAVTRCNNGRRSSHTCKSQNCQGHSDILHTVLHNFDWHLGHACFDMGHRNLHVPRYRGRMDRDQCARRSKKTHRPGEILPQRHERVQAPAAKGIATADRCNSCRFCNWTFNVPKQSTGPRTHNLYACSISDYSGIAYKTNPEFCTTP
jgi:hypothetical protein